MVRVAKFEFNIVRIYQTFNLKLCTVSIFFTNIIACVVVFVFVFVVVVVVVVFYFLLPSWK